MSLKLRLLSLTAVGLVFTAPAFAQTVLNPQQITGANSQAGSLSLSSLASGLTATAIGNQSNSNSLNQLGTSTTALTANTATFAFGQVVGPIDGTLPNTDSFSQSATNGISAQSSSGFLSNVTAGLSGGNQSATNTTNSATFNVLSGSAGTLQQALNFGAASSQTATNSLSAIASSGNATVNGAGNGQIAINGLNTAAGLISVDGTTLGLDQKAPGGAALTLANTNSATANVVAGANPVIDPTVSNLSQTASFGLNTLATSGGALTLTNGGDNQGQTAAFATGSTVATGNTSLAYTGVGLPNTGVGTSAVTNVNQSNGLSVNTASNSGATTYGDLASPFLQNANTANLAVSGQTVLAPATIAGLAGSGPLANQANVLLAATQQGGSSVTGTALSATNSTATQYNGLAINDASSGGAASGYLNQTTTSANGVQALANTASAITTGSGASSVTNVSQAQNLTMNTAAGAGGNALTLQQTANGTANVPTLGGTNVQLASTPVGIASVTGAVQQMASTVNGANLAGVVNGTVQQAASSISQSTGNTLTASGGAGLASGSQSSANAVNVIR